MKKLLFPLVAALLLFSACDRTPKYKITGKVQDGLDGKKVYLRKLEEKGPSAIATDSAVLAKGAFAMKGSVTEPDFYFIIIEGEKMPTLVFMENLPINVTIDLHDATKSSVTGSPLNDLYQTYKSGTSLIQTSMMEISKEFRELQESGTPPSEEVVDGLRKKYADLHEQLQSYQLKFMNDHPNTLVTSYVLNMAKEGMETEQIDNVYSKFDDQLKKTLMAAAIGKELEIAKKTGIGQQFIDLKLPNPAGQEIAISDFAGKGKYVLLDFWASWCGPCRRENPNVVKLYNQYKGEDFEIIGISLDSEADKWAKGIADDKITWPQMSDLKAWESIAVGSYGIKGIPHTILLDRDGKIMAKDLRGDELGAKLAELLGKK